MSNIDICNDYLAFALESRKKLIIRAEPIFRSLYDLFKEEIETAGDKSDELKVWLAKKYWEIIKKRIEIVSDELTEAKDNAVPFKKHEEEEALKEATTRFLADEDKYNMLDGYDILQEGSK